MNKWSFAVLNGKVVVSDGEYTLPISVATSLYHFLFKECSEMIDVIIDNVKEDAGL